MDHLYPLLSRFGTGDAEPARILTRGILRWEIDQDSGALVAREHVEPAASLHKEQFWKLRALLRDVEAAQKAAEQQVNATAQKAQTYLVSLGLKTTVNYQLDDDTTSVTPVHALPPGASPGAKKR